MPLTVTLTSFDKTAGIVKEQGALKETDFFYERFIRPNERQMTRVVWRIMRNREDAEDTLQEALSTIWRKRRLLTAHPNPPALIMKICIDAAYDSLRKSRRRRKHEDPSPIPLDSGGEGRSGIAHSTAVSDANALDKMVRKETEREILDAIGRLPRKQAVVVLMRLIKEQPYDVIAQALGCSQSTARIHLARGRARLNKWLAHLAPNPPGEVRK